MTAAAVSNLFTALADDGAGDARQRIADATDAAIMGVVPWFGSKREMGPEIAEEFGPHRAFFSVFGGSLADLFAKAPSSHETVNDLHGDLVNLVMVLASSRWFDLYQRAAMSMFGDPLFASAQAFFRGPNGKVTVGHYRPKQHPWQVDDADVERAYWYFVLTWMGRNGSAGSAYSHYSLCVRWTPNGGAGAVRFASAADSIPHWSERLRRVTVLCRDFLDVLADIADELAIVIYCDPPYLKRTRGKGGGSCYLFDFKESCPGDPDPLVKRYGDHGRLSRALNRFTRTRVVVSYYDDPALDELYPPARWTKRLMYREKHLSITGRGDAPTTAPEVLLINGPSFHREPEPEADLFNTARRA